jgi:hypothetical protein
MDRERGEDGVSSDDLLRDAKRAYESSIEPTSEAVSSADEAASWELPVEPATAVPAVPAPAVPAPAVPPEPSSPEPPEPPPPEPSTVPDFTIPDPGVPTGLPPEPVEVDVDEVLAGVPAPPEATAKAGNWLSILWRNRWIIVVAIVGITVLAGILDRSRPISDVDVGDCFNDPGFGEVRDVEIVDCADPHDLEAFATVELEGGDYPGEFSVFEQAFDACLDLFEPYVGTPYENSSLYIFPLSPTEGSWNDGDRGAVCVVYEPVGADGEEFSRRVGSVRNSGL